MEALDRVREIDWYHTLELPSGQVTEGRFDLRPYVDRYGLPDRLDGKRVLDIGTWDGFWAFEMERRGAAEVVALDIDDERKLDWLEIRRPEEFRRPEEKARGFQLAKEVLDSSVERVDCSLYDARPEDLGTFDLVLCGSVLIHMRDQIKALERIAALCRGLFICAEGYDRLLSLLPLAVSHYRATRPTGVVFWEPNIRAWEEMIGAAGFEDVRRHGRVRLRSRDGYAVSHVIFHATGSALASS